MKESRNPAHRPTLKDFKEASKRLKGISLHTPLLPLRRYREEDTGILLKPEMIQPIGSYKIRGVYNWVAKLTPKERARGIATLSAGNMSQAVGYVANLFNIPSRVAISDSAPPSKIEACRRYGSEIELVKWTATTFDNADSLAHGYCFIHPLREYGLMDGYGSISLETLDDAPDVDTIFVPMGAGLLSFGIALAAKAIKPNVRVVGVNAENSSQFYAAFKEGKPAAYDFKPTLADGIAGGGVMPPVDSLNLVKEAIDDVVVVSEVEIARAIRLLALENKLVAEGAGAISLAVALATPKEKRGKTVCILSGGSIDAVKLAHILEEQ
jgi:threonine dehydratase